MNAGNVFTLLIVLCLSINVSQAFNLGRLPGLHVVHPSAVDSLNTFSFLGRWFQTHSSWVPTITFEKDGFCVVTDYAATNATSFTMVTSEK